MTKEKNRKNKPTQEKENKGKKKQKKNIQPKKFLVWGDTKGIADVTRCFHSHTSVQHGHLQHVATRVGMRCEWTEGGGEELQYSQVLPLAAAWQGERHTVISTQRSTSSLFFLSLRGRRNEAYLLHPRARLNALNLLKKHDTSPQNAE